MAERFVLPDLIDREEGLWGPTDGDTTSLFNKAERITRIADFIHDDPVLTRGRFGTATTTAAPREETKGGFKTVDNVAKVESLARKKREQTAAPKVATRGGSNFGFRGGNNRGGRGGNRGGSRGGFRGGQNFARGGARGGFRGGANVFRSATVNITDDHTILESFMFVDLARRATIDIPASVDVHTCGLCRYYDAANDRSSGKHPVPLKTFPDTVYTPTTTFRDPVVRQLTKTMVGTHPVIFATDSLLAQIMTSTKSINSWDLQIQKFSRFVFIDRREDDECNVDTQWVGETLGYTAPNDSDPASINCCAKLAQESTNVSRFFASHAVKSRIYKHPGAEKSPFASGGAGKGPQVLYRYRQFTLNEGTPEAYDVVVRCTVDAAHEHDGETLLIRAFGLLENPEGDAGWSTKMDTARGSLLVSEIKANGFKFAKWTAMSILAGVDQMKVAFISRRDSALREKHNICAVETKRPVDFATQIGLSVQNMWSIFHTVITKFLASKPEQGAIVGLMKDPNKPMLQMFLEPQIEDEESSSSEADSTSSSEEDGDDSAEEEEDD